MLDLSEYINQAFEVPERSSKLPVTSDRILAKVMSKDKINSTNH